MSPRNALLGLHVGALAFGLSGIFGELAGTTPMAIVSGRAVFAVFALGLFLAVLGRPLRVACRHLPWLVLGGLLLAAHWLTFFESVRVAGVAIATLGFASFPAFTVVLEVLLGERPRPLEYLMVIVVSIGLLLVAPALDLGDGATQGLILGILSGLLFALLSLLGRALSRRIDPIQVALGQNLVALACSLPFASATLQTLTVPQWLWLALLGVFCTGIAHSLLVASLRVVKARNAAVIFALEPVYGISFAWLLFSQTPTLGMLAGGSLIIAAVSLNALLGSANQLPKTA
ncbi:DMT family transporter [Pseudomonas seleniipraecipitans]|uniref:DMT family transporter n=1 Tax=Phytopseudomonas seleniipraecipitans TaxID=640205 RepID=A0A1G7V2S5_9GAMM|nr:DMT family transporter [Pseudomonas seleniipraecipitans]UUD64084.1 DMT family transporter [Pseudomonas seleniipraecipitans]SDG53868.1 Threonine/homoserine efflux transporter RhtA [Pseudomonas seleniipraecipitans]